MEFTCNCGNDCLTAVEVRHLDCLKRAIKNGAKLDKTIFLMALRFSTLEIVKYLHSQNCPCHEQFQFDGDEEKENFLITELGARKYYQNGIKMFSF